MDINPNNKNNMDDNAFIKAAKNGHLDVLKYLIWLKEKKGDGLLIPSEKEPPRLELIVLTKASFQTLAIVESVSALQNAVEGNRKHWISEIRPLQESAVQKQTLPTWVLMLVLLVGFMILQRSYLNNKTLG